MKAYYNDNDKTVCAWTRELVAARLIPEGDVDERGIDSGASRGVLDPLFSAWLMGYPIAWYHCGLKAMTASSRRRKKKSSGG